VFSGFGGVGLIPAVNVFLVVVYGADDGPSFCGWLRLQSSLPRLRSRGALMS